MPRRLISKQKKSARIVKKTLKRVRSMSKYHKYKRKLMTSAQNMDTFYRVAETLMESIIDRQPLITDFPTLMANIHDMDEQTSKLFQINSIKSLKEQDMKKFSNMITKYREMMGTIMHGVGVVGDSNSRQIPEFSSYGLTKGLSTSLENRYTSLITKYDNLPMEQKFRLCYEAIIHNQPNIIKHFISKNENFVANYVNYVKHEIKLLKEALQTLNVAQFTGSDEIREVMLKHKTNYYKYLIGDLQASIVELYQMIKKSKIYVPKPHSALLNPRTSTMGWTRGFTPQ